MKRVFIILSNLFISSFLIWIAFISPNTVIHRSLPVVAVLRREKSVTYEEFDYLAPLYVPLDSPLVSSLMAVYQEETGDKTPAMSSGGATFARTMENCVAFGALFPGAEQTEHQANERAKIDDLYAAMEIYREAIQRLATI